jgi:PmbA protein
MTEALSERAPAVSAEGELLELAVRVAGAAKSGEELEVYVSRGVETDVRAYEGEVESLSSAASAGVGIRVVIGGRQGFAYAGTLEESVIRQTLADARDNATFATADDHVGLAVPDGVAPASLDLWDEELARMPSSVKVELALELERRTRGADTRVRQVAFADYGDMAAEAAVATSMGITATARRTVCSVAVEAIAGVDTDSQTGVGFSAARGPAHLDLDKATVDAVERATRMLGATKARSGHCAVVLDPRVTSTVLAVVSAALSGEAVTKGRSFFAARVGEEVAVPSLVLVDDPTDARAFGASTHDAEGLACRRNVLIENGVLRGFVFDTTAARRAGVTSTASAVRGGYATTPVAGCRALLLAPGPLGPQDILSEVGEALYVQSITGVHSGVNPVSGDFSVGAEGLMVRGGAMAEPVREVTIASTLQRMLQAVRHIGSDVEWLPGVAAGQTLVIDGMALSGS